MGSSRLLSGRSLLLSTFYSPPSSAAYISPAARFDHHGRLTPPSRVRMLPVM